MFALDRLHQVMAVVSAGLRPLNPRSDISALYVITAGLSGEVGEVMELLKKHIRDNTPIDKQHLACELGDCLVYLIRIANRFDLSFDDVVNAVAEKLEKRTAKGALRGSGEDR